MAIAPPARPPSLPSDQDLNTGLKWSLGLHLAVLIAVLVKGFVFPGTPTPYVPTLRVDVVGLPDILKKDLGKTPSSKEISEILKKAEQEAKKIKPKKLPTEKPVKEIAKPDELVLHPRNQKSGKQNELARERRLRAALDRMKALAAIHEEITQVPRTYKGNKISKGKSLSGDAKESDQSSYYDSVLQRLQENWTLPVWLTRQNLSAQVQIFIDDRGGLHGYRFVKLSGNPQFDEAVKRALKESSPYPAPPGEIAANVLVNGIIFGFPL